MRPKHTGEGSSLSPLIQMLISFRNTHTHTHTHPEMMFYPGPLWLLKLTHKIDHYNVYPFNLSYLLGFFENSSAAKISLNQNRKERSTKKEQRTKFSTLSAHLNHLGSFWSDTWTPLPEILVRARTDHK